MPENDEKVTDDTGSTEGQEPKDNTGGTEATSDDEFTIVEQPSKETKPEGDKPEDDGDLPDWAKTADKAELVKQIRKLREENGKDRTVAKEKAAAEAREKAEADAAAERAKAVEAARTEMADAIAKALGLKPEEKAELTPEQVVEQLTQERDQEKQARGDLEKRLRELELENAIQDAAAMHEAIPDKLTDSRSFMKRANELDPEADGYRVAIAELVKEYVDNDGSMKAVKKPAPPPVSGGNTVAGSKAKTVEDMTIDEMIAAGFTKRR